MCNPKYIFSLFLMLACQMAVAANSYEEMVAAVKQDRPEVVAGLIKRGFDPDTSDQEGNTLLMIAAKEGSAAAVKQLLAARAKVESRNEFGETALMMAAIKGNVEITRALVERGASINFPGWTPLMYAAVMGH